MRRVVVTGMGLKSCLGNTLDEAFLSLKLGKSGIRKNQDFIDLGFRSQVSAWIDLNPLATIDRSHARFMGEAAGFAYLSMEDAIADAGLCESEVSDERTGLIMGSGGTSSKGQIECADIIRHGGGVKRVGPCRVPQIMGSTVSACLSTAFKIKGYNYSISSACATSAHCIGNGLELIQYGKQDIVFVGGGEEMHWNIGASFDGMKALSDKYNDCPEKASRAYDKDRCGFVIGCGGGCLVLEEYEHAKKRNANIYAELIGYGVTSDGDNMVLPSGDGARRCMAMAMSNVNDSVDYINTHGTSTPIGDIIELEAIANFFGEDRIPWISSTKSLSGHALGVAGVHEAIFCLLMMKNSLLIASANIEYIDDQAKQFPIITTNRQQKVNVVVSNSFGFGGANATLVFKKL